MEYPLTGHNRLTDHCFENDRSQKLDSILYRSCKWYDEGSTGMVFDVMNLEEIAAAGGGHGPETNWNGTSDGEMLFLKKSGEDPGGDSTAENLFGPRFGTIFGSAVHFQPMPRLLHPQFDASVWQ